MATKKTKTRPMPRRFMDLKIGDRLAQRHRECIDYKQEIWADKIITGWVVTDSWFDPVVGQDDPIAGTMVAVRREGTKRKYGYPIRGLATAGFFYEGGVPERKEKMIDLGKQKISAADSVFGARDGDA